MNKRQEYAPHRPTEDSNDKEHYIDKTGGVVK